ncbi:MAG: helix-turn-helix domain-containing protein [Eubacteriales bacterium]
MFDTLKVAKKIKEARIAQNMTQLAVADSMEVSYQAVSNWERGNSMPDISKLEQLCRVLKISLEELLDSDEKAAEAVTKVLDEEEPEMTIEELNEISAIMSPAELQKQLESAQKNSDRILLSTIGAMASYLDNEYLNTLLDRAEVDSIDAVISIAPFLEEEVLDKLADKAVPKNLSELVGLAPYVSESRLSKLIKRCEDVSDMGAVSALAPFISADCFDYLVEKNMDSSDFVKLSGVAHFMDSGTVRKMAEKFIKDNNIEALRNIAPFM